MAIALVPSQTAAAFSVATGTSIAVSFPSAVTAGNLIAVKCSVDNSVTVSSVVMTGETFNPGIQLADPTNAQKIEGWYAKNTVGGQTQVTENYSATAPFRHIGISEWSGADTGAPLDKTNGALNNGTAGSETTLDVTPTSDGQLIWAALESGNGVTPTANSPFTLLESNTGLTGSEYDLQSVAAAIHGDFASTGATHWGVVIMTFKAAAAVLAPSVGLSMSIAGTPSIAGVW